MNILSNHRNPTATRTAVSKMSSLCLTAVLVLACLSKLSAARVLYSTGGTPSSVGRDCTEAWCGEQWKAHRILYYNLRLNSTLVVKNQTSVSTINICAPNAQHSGDCEETETIETTELTSVRVVSLQRTTEEPVTILQDGPELDHHFLLSDNMELAAGGPTLTSDLYPANQTKIWQMKIPKGCKMFVSFLQFSIEKSTNCLKDYFSVQTSKNPDDVLVFCNELEDIEIRRRRRVQFTLHSDHANHNGQLAASVCLSKMDSDRSRCDCFQPTRRRRSSPHNTDFLEESANALLNKRLETLERLNTNRRFNPSS